MNRFKTRRNRQIQGLLLRIGVAAVATLCARAFSAELPAGDSVASGQKRMLVVRPNQCASTRVRLFEYSPEARPLVLALLAEEKSYCYAAATDPCPRRHSMPPVTVHPVAAFARNTL